VIVVHHHAVDNLSWPIVLGDLATAYEQLARVEPVRLERPPVTFARWARELAAFAQSAEVRGTAEFWLSEARRGVGRLPTDHDAGPNTEASARKLTRTFPAADTAALFEAAQSAYRMRPHEVVLTALGSALGQWSGQRRVLVDVEGHGREALPAGLDVSRTCGWFTTLVPTLLEFAPAGGAGEALEAGKEQLRAVPHRGLSYGLLRHMGDDAALRERLAALPQAEVCFNYLGEVGGGEGGEAEAEARWRAAGEDRGPLRRPDALRNHLVDVLGAVVDGALKVEWSYTPHRHHPATVERLADGFVAQLHLFLEHCLAPEAGGLTPSDFPHAGLSREALDALLPQIG